VRVKKRKYHIGQIVLKSRKHNQKHGRILHSIIRFNDFDGIGFQSGMSGGIILIDLDIVLVMQVILLSLGR